MSLAAGTRLGPYEVTAPLGSGGMGEVYRARDTRLGREVAVKVLPAGLTADAERLRRFEQEARAASVLNHPNIIAIHDVGTHDGSPYVVTELLEGETLRERINGVALPPRKAVEYAGQVARGLAAAHDRGIVHRDLKPENLFVTRDGRVKILDFGLAKLKGIEAMTDRETRSAADLGDSGTGAGTVLGTVGYMSPEQVRAQPVDHRSDIFSFGAVLYEMLSGRRAFRGASAVETMNAILKEDPPDLSDTNRNLPPALERIVGHCLEKNPEERFQSARDIAFDLDALSGQSALAVSRAGSDRRARWLKPVAAGLAVVAAVAAAFVVGRRTALAPVPDFIPLTFRRGSVDTARFTPDGKTIVFTARWEGKPPEIFSTQQGSPEARSFDLTDAVLVSVSNSGEMAVGLRRPPRPGRTLARVPVGGGAPREVLDSVDGADWSPDGSSLLVVRRSGPRLRIEFPIGKTLYESGAAIKSVRVSPKGDRVAFTEHVLLTDNRGDVVMVDLAGKKTILAGGWEDLGGLAWSPDGREVWFSASNSGADRRLYAVTLDGKLRLVARVPGNFILHDIASDGRVLVSHGTMQAVMLGLVPGDTKERDLTWLDFSIAADLSADGKTLLFTEQGVAGGPQYAVYTRGTDGSPAVRLGKGNAQAPLPGREMGACPGPGSSAPARAPAHGSRRAAAPAPPCHRELHGGVVGAGRQGGDVRGRGSRAPDPDVRPGPGRRSAAPGDSGRRLRLRQGDLAGRPVRGGHDRHRIRALSASGRRSPAHPRPRPGRARDGLGHGRCALRPPAVPGGGAAVQGRPPRPRHRSAKPLEGGGALPTRRA
jgi:Tol biopolymer transport system component